MKLKCNNCGYEGDLADFTYFTSDSESGNSSYENRCSKCGSTNIKVTDLSLQWKMKHNDRS